VLKHFQPQYYGHVRAGGSFGFAFGYRLLEAVPYMRPMLGVSFLVATMMEALAPLAFFWRSFRRLFVAFALVFHAANLLLLNIEFTLNLLVIVLILIEWTPDAVRARLGRAARP
jgi:hypothetical protein